MSGWENIARHGGVSIAISGMTVVFAVLALISGFITLLPRALAMLHQIAPEADHHTAPMGNAVQTASPIGNAVQTTSPDEAVAAAIGYAMHLGSRKPTSA